MKARKKQPSGLKLSNIYYLLCSNVDLRVISMIIITSIYIALYNYKVVFLPHLL